MGNVPIARTDWKPIAKAVEDRLYGREALLERTLGEEQSQWVDRVVRQVGSEGRWEPLASAPANEALLDGVRADAVSHTDTAELGPVLLGWEIWKRLSMPELLETLGFNRSQAQAAAISVIHRLADPTSEHNLWQLYISLTRAEAGFKALKTDLGLRPNPHRKEERVDAHVFICVLAYHLLRNILWTLEQKGDRRNWDPLKRVLRTHCYTTIPLPTRNGQTHRIRIETDRGSRRARNFVVPEKLRR